MVGRLIAATVGPTYHAILSDTGCDIMSPAIHEADNRRVNALIGQSRPTLDATIERFEDLVALRSRWAQVEAMPVLLNGRHEGIDHSWAGLNVRTLLRGEQSAGRFAAHSVILTPGAGLPAHYHEDVHTYIAVTEGEVELGVGALVERVGKYNLGYIPPRARQSFRNTSTAPAALAVFYSPAGAERAFEATHDHWMATRDQGEEVYLTILARHGFRFDSEVLEKDNLTNAALPPLEFEIKGPGDLEVLRGEFRRRPALPRLVRTTPEEISEKPAGTTFRKEAIRGDDTAGEAMINLLSGSHGFNAPPHHQPTEDEFFFIMDGVLEMTCATETTVLKPGGFAFCPRNCTHAFRNPSPTDTRFFTLNSPAGHERAMAAVRRLSQAGASKKQLYEQSVAGGFIFHDLP